MKHACAVESMHDTCILWNMHGTCAIYEGYMHRSTFSCMERTLVSFFMHESSTAADLKGTTMYIVQENRGLVCVNLAECHGTLE